ncbi:MAG: ComEC/Rec2 family competence protein [Clostridia bacterium]|nr:ComEC/Rec2 family competence protein [Clostridia bacterium]
MKLAYAESLKSEKNVVAEIKECTYRARYIEVYTVRIESIDGQAVNFNAEISTSNLMALERGDRISADMSFSPFSETAYGYDERMANISSGILSSASFDDADVLENNTGFNFLNFIAEIRERIGKTIDKNFGANAPIIKALLIGDTSDIETETNYAFKSLGISHILSISGTHFTVLLGMATFLLSLLGLGKRKVYFVLIPIALFYMGLSGFSFSVCRAGIMAILSFWGFLCGRPRDSYTALFVSFTAIVLIAPYSIMSISLWLSFTATLTILIIIDVFGAHLFNSKRKWYAKIFFYILSNLLITVCISFSTLPIIALYFGYISTVSPIANLLIVPLYEIFLYIIPFAVSLSNLALPVTITEAYGSYVMSLVNNLADTDGILAAVNYDFVTIFSCIGITLTLILLAFPLKRKIFISIPSIISIIAIVAGIGITASQNADNTCISYFVSGKSDGIVVTDNNETMYIDITNGSSSSSYFAEHIAKENHSVSLSAYVFTHYRSNHVNTFKKLISRTKVKTVYLAVAKDEAGISLMNQIADIAEDYNIEIVYYDYGAVFDFESCTVNVFEQQFLGRSSHEVISLNISAKGKDILYLGSSFAETEYNYATSAANAEYIFFGQHYPKTKNMFDLKTSATLIYGNEEVYGFSKINAPAYVLSDGLQYDIVLK